MARHTSPQVKEDITANLIPMIDIMFLLLLFFMLGADMSRRELADLVLPTADQVREDEKLKTEEDAFHTVANICHKPDDPKTNFHCAVNAKDNGICRTMDHWTIMIRAHDYTLETVKDEVKHLAEDDGALEADVDPVAKRRMSKRKVSIRADRAAPYGLVQGLIQLCGLAAIYKIEIDAAMPPTEKKT